MTFDETDVAPPDHARAAPRPPVQDPWRDMWSAALGRVELDVDAAETLLQRLHEEDLPAPLALPSWSVPSLPGPMPVDFTDRARRLLARQVDVSERLAAAMVQARSQTNALRKFHRPEARPVFVDRAL
ncbi:hypothetical protein GTR02_06520 [Kineococcus sp. R8]|uniref:hypothetical protein n=1 Tax=Kineococcus siccus TaxID=2696567 RepID=UPI00141232F8|nr:hypothetical protein [Kineococcus siccus]NAZ81468.1 hypothetical protein [Kineococcus siccus]